MNRLVKKLVPKSLLVMRISPELWAHQVSINRDNQEEQARQSHMIAQMKTDILALRTALSNTQREANSHSNVALMLGAPLVDTEEKHES